ncbi:MAG: MoaD/ThiS family protein [Desulfatitalea sp.]|nr:MoaD/ThiS family protein [Desulfatitalea sp.]
MRIVVKLYNELRPYASILADDGSLELPEGATPRELLTKLGIPPDRHETLPLFRNGRPGQIDTPLRERDVIVAFAPMSGG